MTKYIWILFIGLCLSFWWLLPLVMAAATVGALIYQKHGLGIELFVKELLK